MQVNLPTASELNFFEKGHRYEIGGARIPCVSNIIEIISKITYLEINKSTLNMAAKRGTSIHKSIERFNKSGVIIVDEKYINHFDQYIKFYNETNFQDNFEIIKNEYKLYHKTKLIAGTIDCLAINKQTGRLALIDYKCTANLNTHLVSLQLRFYYEILLSWGIKVEEVYELNLKKDSYKFIPLTDLVLSSYTQTICVSLENVYTHLMKNGLLTYQEQEVEIDEQI